MFLHVSTDGAETFRNMEDGRHKHSDNHVVWVDPAIRGTIEIAALTNGEPQPAPSDGFALYRVGDTAASRVVAAAIYEARRLCQLL